MRCKPGDLAFIVRARKFPQWVGKVVRVTRPCTLLRNPSWHTEPELHDPEDGALVVCEDFCLSPIRPDPIPETVTDDMEVPA